MVPTAVAKGHAQLFLEWECPPAAVFVSVFAAVPHRTLSVALCMAFSICSGSGGPFSITSAPTDRGNNSITESSFASRPSISLPSPQDSIAPSSHHVYTPRYATAFIPRENGPSVRR